MLIALYVYDELSFDKMFVDSDRIYRINSDIKFGGAENIAAVVPAPMADVLVKDFPQVETATRFRTIGSTLLKKVALSVMLN